MARRLPVDLSIGKRIQTRRKLRRWSIRFAASRAGIAHTTWSRIERGELRTDRYMIADLAAALECSITDLTGQPYAPTDRKLEAAHIHAQQVWQQMMAHPFDEVINPRHPIEAVNREAALVRDLYGRTDYAGTLHRLVDLIPNLHSHTIGAHKPEALRHLVAVYGCAMGALINVGYPAHAWVAADRSTEAASMLDDPVALAVGAVNRARVSSSSGAFGPARNICDRAEADLQPHLSHPDALAANGFLHLARAHHAAGLHDQGAAQDHLAEAAAIAARTGETDAWDLAWGPTNVSLWTMAYQLDSGDPAAAIETAQGLKVANLPAVRQVYFYLDMARGFADTGRPEESERMLLHAERTGPQHTRSSAAGRETARALLHRSRIAAATSPLHGLCERMGVLD